jgi:hypothetical protein
MAQRKDVTRFVNVDLEVVSKDDLAPLVHAMGRRVHDLYVERERRGFFARLELAAHPRTPDDGIRRFAALVAKLPAHARRLWDEARSRELDIGVASGEEPWITKLTLSPATLQLASDLDARVVFTVYGRARRARS